MTDTKTTKDKTEVGRKSHTMQRGYTISSVEGEETRNHISQTPSTSALHI